MKPLNKKLIPYSKAFKQVSKVLGKEGALKQLELVWECPECFEVDFKRGKKLDLRLEIYDLFVWVETFQGFKYWDDIHTKIKQL